MTGERCRFLTHISETDVPFSGVCDNVNRCHTDISFASGVCLRFHGLVQLYCFLSLLALTVGIVLIAHRTATREAVHQF
jgi:hypothetical protein